LISFPRSAWERPGLLFVPGRTRSVRAAFPRGAWERDRGMKKFNCVTPKNIKKIREFLFVNHSCSFVAKKA